MSTPVTPYPACNLVTINIRKTDIEDDQIWQDCLGRANAILSPVDGENLISLNAKIGVQHLGDIKVIFDDQNLGFGFCHVNPTCLGNGLFLDNEFTNCVAD